MTPRQRWLALLEGRQADRIPTDYSATPEVTQRLMQDLDCSTIEELYARLDIDARRHVGPRCLQPHHPDDVQADVWGIRRARVDYGTGSYSEVVHHPLAEARSAADVHAFKWPSPDIFDVAPVTEAIAADDGQRAIAAAVYEPFLIYCAMRGMEQAFEDLLTEPEIADAILGHLFDFHYELNRRVYEAGQRRIDVTYVAEDMGAQTGPLWSLDVYKRFLLPNQKKMADLARSFDIHVMFHTDGAARQFIPLLIDEVGIEVLNPIQWRCPGMEREGLVRDFGDHLVFHGAIDNQQTLAFGSVRDVIDEVRESAAIFKDARWICAPCHNLQPVSPTENIVALYETIREVG